MTWSTSLDLLGLVNTKVAVSVNTNHTWGEGTTLSDNASLTLRPSQTGYITRATQNGTITGDFDFTNQYGILFHVKNVSVTSQAVQDVKNPSVPTVTYGQHWIN